MVHSFANMYETLGRTANFGEVVSYTAPGGSPTSVDIVGWIEDPPTLGADMDGRSIIRTARAIVEVSFLAAPVRNAVVTRNSEEWTVYLAPKINASAHELHLKRVETETKAHTGHRIDR